MRCTCARLDAAFRVAVDIALPYLKVVPAIDGLALVCADAEYLPFRAGFFDVIIVSGVLEHILEPEKLVARLATICHRGDARDRRTFRGARTSRATARWTTSSRTCAASTATRSPRCGRSSRSRSGSRTTRTCASRSSSGSSETASAAALQLARRALLLRAGRGAGCARLERRERRLAALPRREWLWRLFYPPVFQILELRLRPRREPGRAGSPEGGRRRATAPPSRRREPTFARRCRGRGRAGAECGVRSDAVSRQAASGRGASTRRGSALRSSTRENVANSRRASSRDVKSVCGAALALRVLVVRAADRGGRSRAHGRPEPTRRVAVVEHHDGVRRPASARGAPRRSSAARSPVWCRQPIE